MYRLARRIHHSGNKNNSNNVNFVIYLEETKAG
jgi:hypothetical protein